MSETGEKKKKVVYMLYGFVNDEWKVNREEVSMVGTENLWCEWVANKRY